jgi:hypothetical protein
MLHLNVHNFKEILQIERVLEGFGLRWAKPSSLSISGGFGGFLSNISYLDCQSAGRSGRFPAWLLSWRYDAKKRAIS